MSWRQKTNPNPFAAFYGPFPSEFSEFLLGANEGGATPKNKG